MVALAYIFLCLCWSTTWQAIRLCLLGYPPLFGAALRFLLATGLLALLHTLLSLRQPRGTAGRWFALTDRRQHLALAAAGAFNGLGYAGIYLAEQTLSGGTTAVICASSPLFTLLLARLVGLEPLILGRVFGMSIGLAGVVVLFSDGLLLGSGPFHAMLLAGGAAILMWPLYGALLKRYAQNLPPMVSTTYFLFYTALTLFGLSLARGESLPALHSAPLSAHLGLIYLAVMGSVVAWTLYLWLLKRLDLSVASTLGLVQPVVALGIDLLLHEAQLHSRGYMGAMLVILGMGLSTRRTR